VLSREQTLIFAKVLWRFDMKLREAVREEILPERRGLYKSQSWPYFEGSHDRLLQGMVRASQDLEMAAATSVGISLTNWRDSLKVHFPYPNKDQALCSLYKEVLCERRKPLVEEQVKA